MKKLNAWLIHRQPIDSEEHRKRVLMAGYFILIYIGTGTFWLLSSLFDGSTTNYTPTLVGYFINLACIFLIRYGWFYTGTFIFLLRANAVTLYYAWAYPEYRNDLFFISAGLAAVAIFGFEKRRIGVTFSLLSLFLYVIITAQPEKWMAADFTHINQVAGFVLTFLSLFLLILFFNFITHQYDQIIQQKNLELEESNNTKDKFFSIIGHDLKSPINSLSSFSMLLIDHMESLSKDEIKMLARDVDKSLKNLSALLDNLLQWSRSQTGAIEFHPHDFDVSVLIQGNKDLLQPQAETKQIRIELANPHSLVVRAHVESVDTVIRNLMSNAIKFTARGGRVTVMAEKSRDEVIVSIMDTGVGIPLSIVDKLFRIDVRHSTNGTANEKGTGLGLVLCKEFVEKNGGNLGVQSIEGQGSTFYFTLPVGRV
jgi:signal transduction histidine kinase